MELFCSECEKICNTYNPCDDCNVEQCGQCEFKDETDVKLSDCCRAKTINEFALVERWRENNEDFEFDKRRDGYYD